jgi:YVTN family beta-propeller protein
MRASFLISLLLSLPAAAATVRIIQTNSAGDNLHIIDPETNKVVGVIHGIEANHGVAVAPDGSRFYVSDEAEDTLDVVSSKTLEISGKVPLSGHPNNIAISKDGRRVYVAIIQTPGAVDVIDTASLAKVKSIPTKGGIHNTYVTPDGKFILAGSIAGKLLTVIDSATEEIAWELKLDKGVRPMAFEKNPDGSTHRVFMQLSDVHGFAVIDFAGRKEVARVMLPEPLTAKPDIEGTPSHGIGVSPDGRTLWINSMLNSKIYAYSLPDLKLIGGADVGKVPDWITFTPDSKRVYVSNSRSNYVSVVDMAAMKEIARIPVGEVPKRNITAILP